MGMGHLKAIKNRLKLDKLDTLNKSVLEAADRRAECLIAPAGPVDQSGTGAYDPGPSGLSARLTGGPEVTVTAIRGPPVTVRVPEARKITFKTRSAIRP